MDILTKGSRTQTRTHRMSCTMCTKNVGGVFDKSALGCAVTVFPIRSEALVDNAKQSLTMVISKCVLIILKCCLLWLRAVCNGR